MFILWRLGIWGRRDLTRHNHTAIIRLTPREACCKEPCRPPSSSGPGSGVLSPVTRVQIPLGVLKSLCKIAFLALFYRLKCDFAHFFWSYSFLTISRGFSVIQL